MDLFWMGLEAHLRSSVQVPAARQGYKARSDFQPPRLHRESWGAEPGPAERWDLPSFPPLRASVA